MPPLHPFAGYRTRHLFSLEEHRVLFQKSDVIGAVLRKGDLLAGEDHVKDGDQRETAKQMTELNMQHSILWCLFGDGSNRFTDSPVLFAVFRFAVVVPLKTTTHFDLRSFSSDENGDSKLRLCG